MSGSACLRFVQTSRWTLVTVALGIAGCVPYERQVVTGPAVHSQAILPGTQGGTSSVVRGGMACEPASSPFGQINFDDHDGYVQIFDGVSLKNWEGDPAVWHVENDAIVGESSKENPVANSYISFRGFEAKDFDLKLEIKVENNGGSGLQYRSQTGLPWKPRFGQVNPNLNWMMTGPQADFWFPVNPESAGWTGQFYPENMPLGAIVRRGQVVESGPGDKRELLGIIGDRNALGGFVRVNDWNQYFIMARGGTFIHVINGRLMAVYVDDDPKSSNNRSGLIGIEIEGYPLDRPTKVSVRHIWIKKIR